jgi:hypothetical protein
MSPVPEVMLGVLILLILLGFFAGPSTKSSVHPDTGFGSSGQAVGTNAAAGQGISSAAGNTSGNQLMSMPSVSKEPQVSALKES